MKKILLSSFFIAFGIAAMAQVKPSSKQATTPHNKANTEAAQKALAAHIAWKNKMAADVAKGINPNAKPVNPNAAELVTQH
jgi:hypothetical protein